MLGPRRKETTKDQTKQAVTGAFCGCFPRVLLMIAACQSTTHAIFPRALLLLLARHRSQQAKKQNTTSIYIVAHRGGTLAASEHLGRSLVRCDLQSQN
jgi:hypothetical protein